MSTSDLPLLSHAAKLVLPYLVPEIHTVGGTHATELVTHPAIAKPGVYIGTWKFAGETVWYVGMSGWNVGSRLRDAKFRLPRAVDRLFTITDASGDRSVTDTRVLERLIHLTALDAKYRVAGDVPSGAVVTPDRYRELRRFLAEVSSEMQIARLAFETLSPARLLAGPVTEYGVVRDVVPPGPRYTMPTRLGPAEMVEFGSSYVVVPGSPVRIRPSSAGGTVGVVAQVLFHAGILQPVCDGLFTLTKPVRFPSPSAASRFVTGTTGGTPDLWRGAAGAGPRSPTRVAHAYPPASHLEPVAAEDRSEAPLPSLKVGGYDD